MTTSQVHGQQDQFAALKQVPFGPANLDGFMLDDGEFRMSMRSAARAVGCQHQYISNRLRGFAPAQTLTGATDPGDSALKTLPPAAIEADRRDKPIIIPVRARSGGGTAHTINIATAVHVWGEIAKSQSIYAEQAFNLVMMCAAQSLEARFQEAFGVTDSRNVQDRLIDWAVKFDPGEHTKLFGGPFAKHFARVTGVAIGHPYARTCLAELVYHRLPKPVYEAMKDLNPEKQNGWREYTHSQLMTDDMLEEVRKILLVVTHELANTDSKNVNAKAYRTCLHRLDKMLPRHTKRGKNAKYLPKGVQTEL